MGINFDMYKIFYRYLASNFILPFILSLFFFVMFLLTFQLFRITRFVVGKDIEIFAVIEIIAHISISFIPLATPLAILFASYYTMNKLSSDSEIIAMRSFGLNKYKLFAPFLISGLIISISIFSLNRNIIPYSKREFSQGMVNLTSKGILKDIKPEQFFTDIKKITLFAEKVKNEGQFLENVFLNIKDKKSDNQNEQVILATTGFARKE